MSGKTVLIVEDESIVAAHLALLLRQLDYEVVGIAASGEEAVESACRLLPRAVLMDIRLQGPMDGIEAAAAIRRHIDVPVIYLTAHSDAATLERAKRTEPFGYILKPFEERELAPVIEMALYKHQAERDLREQREWLRVTLTSIGDAVITCDIESRVTFLNPTAEGLMGWSLEQARGLPIQKVFTVIDESTKHPVEDPVAVVLRDRRPTMLGNHVALVTKDGREVPIDDSAAPILDASGRVTGAVLVFHDVTERRRSRAALEAFVECAPVALAMFDRSMRYVRISKRWRTECGLDEAEILGRSHYEVFPDLPEAWKEAHRRGLAGESLRNEEDWVGLDGGTHSIRWEIQPWGDSRVETGGIIIFLEDITERKRADEALRTSEDRLAAVIANATDGIVSVDEAQQIVLFNAAAERIFGYEASQVVGTPLERLLPERFRKNHREHIRTFGATGSSVAAMHSLKTLVGRRADGAEFPFEATMSQALVGGQKLYTAILRDLTQRKEAEALAERYARSKELDRLKTEFFANISHELRTPLALILGPLQKRLGARDITEAERRDLEVVDRNAQLLLRRVNDLLDLSKLDAGKMSAEYATVDLGRLGRLAASHFQVLAEERNTSFSIDIPDSLHAELDPSKIERVVLNLLSNAFKFTPTGGRVRFAVRRNENRAILEVEDSGPGIPVDLRGTVFERFKQLEGGATRRFGGTGLGLSIAREFVSLHRGSITVGESTSGGSLFTVELPLAAPSGSQVLRTGTELDLRAGRFAAEELGLRSTGRLQTHGTVAPDAPVVLVVEDNPDMNAFISQTLSGTCRVLSAFDGREGLAMALGLRPDLVLCDVMMPHLSGDELVRELRKHDELSDMPIVLLTAKADEKMQVELLKEGAQDYLCKPFRAEELLARVERIVLDRRRAAEELRATRHLSARLIESRDQERLRVSHELHENVAQYLAALRLSLGAISRSTPSDEMHEVLYKGLEWLATATRDILTVSHDLHPVALDSLGLAAAIESHVTRFSSINQIEVNVDVSPGFGRLKAEHELALFRIVQEALTNVRRHSGSTKAIVRVFRDAEEVGVEVIDAGGGLPVVEGPTIANVGKGTGILAMRERVRTLGGRLEITSGGGGTTLRAVLPFNAQSEADDPYEPHPERV